MLDLYMVTKKPMTLIGGEVRQPGDLLPEATAFPPRVKKVLLDADEMARVLVVSPKQYKKIESALKAPLV